MVGKLLGLDDFLCFGECLINCIFSWVINILEIWLGVVYFVKIDRILIFNIFFDSVKCFLG